ncbi:MAG: hypothetical protein ACRCXD_15710 [Luteolibacter sp.]
MKVGIFYPVFPLMLLLASCDELQTSKPKSAPPSDPGEELQAPPSLADITTLTDKLGRSLEVKVIGHNSEEIRFIRLSDNKPFRWKIDELSPSDQELVRKMPSNDDSFSTHQNIEVSPNILNRRKQIERLRKEIELLERELPGLLQSTTKGISPRAKGLERQIELKLKEIAEIEAEISEIDRP